uniref:Uncharacterized protein n=1 Tax=Oryza nivara TaxID=4536 RepID=A0A0E0IAT5_ORYNI
MAAAVAAAHNASAAGTTEARAHLSSFPCEALSAKAYASSNPSASAAANAAADLSTENNKGKY